MTTPTPTIKTRLLILSDTHTAPPFPPSPSPQHPYTSPLPPADILIHCGDLTRVGRESEYRTTFEWIAAHPAELKLVVAGNHDITLDETFYADRGWRMHGEAGEDVGRCGEVWCGEEARERGVVYLEEGVRGFGLGNGARFVVYSSPYQPEYEDWAFPYPRHIDRFNPTPPATKPIAANPVPNHPAIDIMITHGPPKNILDKTYPGNEHVGCDHLRKAVERCKPRIHCFGHIHEGWGAERMDWSTKEVRKVEVERERGAYVDLSEGSGEGLRWGEETLFVNASIMDVGYHPVNAPWVVDLDLPVKGKRN